MKLGPADKSAISYSDYRLHYKSTTRVPKVRQH